MKIIQRGVVFLLIGILALSGPMGVLAESVDKPSSSVLKRSKKGGRDSTSADEHQALSAEDLGFSQDEIKSDPQFQKDLEARSDMLKIHQTLGLITAIPMTAQLVIGLTTTDSVSKGNTDVSLHTTLGLATAGLYITTAMFAILAPKPKGLKPSGNTEFHQILSWIHMPLMILVPLVGDMVVDRIANHEPIGNLGAIHGLMATTLVASYLTSMTVMTF